MSGARPASQPEGYLCFPRSGATAHAWQSNFSSIFKTPLCPSGLLKSKTPNSYASPLQGYCVSSWKQCLKPAAAFLGSREHFFESKRQHVSHKATCKQQALASSYSKGQVGRIIIIFFFATAIQMELNKAATCRSSSSTAPAQEGTRGFPNTTALQRTGEWLPDDTLVTILPSSQRCLGTVNSEHRARADTRQSVSMAISPC